MTHICELLAAAAAAAATFLCEHILLVLFRVQFSHINKNAFAVADTVAAAAAGQREARVRPSE